jgi:3-oxoacyl-[acyl-carrier-protein] synthase-3
MATGSAVPDKVLTNADLERIVDTTSQWILEHTGIQERRICTDGEATSDLAARAAQRALERSGVSPEDIDLVIVATVTPDYTFPASACLVQDRIGAVNAAGFDLEAGCTGFVYALCVGSAFISAEMYDHVIVIGADALSKVTDWTDRATCVLFGDAAGAALLGPCERGSGVLSYVLESEGSLSHVLDIPIGGARCPITPENIGERKHLIQMDGHEVFKQAVRRIPQVSQKAIEKAGLQPEDVSYLLLHQANQRITDSVLKRFRLPKERVLTNLDRYGNTSNGTIPLLLDEANQEGKLKPGDILTLVGFGAGFTDGAVVVKWG